MSLLTKLPPELLYQVASHINLRSLNSLVRTSHAFHSALSHRLYEKGCAIHESEVLVWAAHKGQIATVRKFLELFPPSALENPQQFYALAVFISIERQREDVFEVMLEVTDPDFDDLSYLRAWVTYSRRPLPPSMKNIHPAARDEDFQLHYFLEGVSSHKDLFHAGLGPGFAVEPSDHYLREYHHPMITAIRGRCEFILRFLLERYLSSSSNIHSWPKSGEGSDHLHSFTHRGNFVREGLASPGHVHARCHECSHIHRALYLAVSGQGVDMVELIFDTWSQSTSIPRRVLAYVAISTWAKWPCAYERPVKKTFKFLQDHDIDLTFLMRGCDDFLAACVMRHLIDSGVDPNALCGDGLTYLARFTCQLFPMFLPIRNPYCRAIDIVKLLLEAGADPDAKSMVDKLNDAEGRTIISDFILGPFPFTSRGILLLMRAGVDLDYVRDNGHTPLYDAIASRRKVMVDILVRKGANIHRRDSRGRTPLSFAYAHGFRAAVGILQRAGASKATRPYKKMRSVRPRCWRWRVSISADEGLFDHKWKLCRMRLFRESGRYRLRATAEEVNQGYIYDISSARMPG